MPALMDKERERMSVSEPYDSLKMDFTEPVINFLYQSIIAVQSHFGSFINGVTLSEQTQFKTTEEMIKTRQYFIQSANEIVHLIQNEPTPEHFANAKYQLDDFFFNITDKGRLFYNYKTNYLMATKEAAEQLRISKPTLLSTYVEKGMEYLKDVKGHKKIPQHAVLYFSNPVWATKIHLLSEAYKDREKTWTEKYTEVLNEIKEFEAKYQGKKFEEVFANVLNGEKEGDLLENADDFFEWSDLLGEAKEYEQRLHGE